MSTFIPLHFATSDMPGDIAIRYAQAGYWATHVDVVLPGERFLASLPTYGVNIYPRYHVAREEFVDLPCEDQQLADFMAYMTSQIGKPYALLELLDNFVLDRNWREQDRWFCSELVGSTLERCGWFPNPLATGVQKLSVLGLALAISARVPVRF